MSEFHRNLRIAVQCSLDIESHEFAAALLQSDLRVFNVVS